MVFCYFVKRSYVSVRAALYIYGINNSLRAIPDELNKLISTTHAAIVS